MTNNRFALVARKLNELEQAIDDTKLEWCEDLPHEIRAKLHVLASSINDFTLWVYERPYKDDPDDKGWYALEVETGCGAYGVTAREALNNYFRDDVLDYPRT